MSHMTVVMRPRTATGIDAGQASLRVITAFLELYLYILQVQLFGSPHPAMVTIRDNGD